MIKKLFYVITALANVGIAKAQVGINTPNPQGVFHVDGAKDNPATGAPSAAQQSNDFIVTAVGNVGVGTTTPSKKLEIVSATSPALRIADGTQQANYTLMSDANGNASWKSITTAIIGTFSPQGISLDISKSNYVWTNASIDLPPGKWLVLTNVVLSATPTPTPTGNLWARLTWSNTQGTLDATNITGNLNSGIYVSTLGTANGATIINNTSSATKTYYLNTEQIEVYGNYSATWNNIGSSAYKENSIVAYPAN